MFSKRLYRSYQFNVNLIKSITDWTVLLYLVVPSIIIGFFLYRDFAVNFQVIELQQNFLLTLLFGLSFFLVKTSIRLFVYDADLLFYKQQVRKIHQIKLFGYSYSFIYFNFVLIILLLLTSPFLVLPYWEVLFALNIISVLHIFIQYKCQKWFTKWPLLFVIHALIIFNLAVLPFWVFSLLLLAAHLLLLNTVLSNRYWSIETRWEYEAFYGWMKHLYQFSLEMRHYMPAKTKQPLILLAKKKILSTHRIDNLIYKTLLRKLNYLKSPVQLIVLVIALLFVLPIWAKAIVLIFSFIGLNVALSSILNEIKQAPFFQLMSVQENEWLQAKTRLKYRLFPPLGIVMMLLLFIS
ncbi:ABC transporter permease [Solibacillus silvestris]